MLSLQNVESIIGYITLLLAYFLTIGPVGGFRAWTAAKMGDDTAEQLGYLTVNPLAHIDLLGMFWLFVFSTTAHFSGFVEGRKIPIFTSLGWGKHVPIDSTRIGGRHRWLKTATAYLSDSFAHFVLALIGTICFALLFNAPSLSSQTSTITPLMLVLFQVLFAFITLNVWLTIIQFVANSVFLLALYFSAGRSQSIPYLFYILFLAPLVILLLFGHHLWAILHTVLHAIKSLFV